MRTDLSYIHPERCYIYIKGYSLKHLIYNHTFESTVKLVVGEYPNIIDFIVNQLRIKYSIDQIKRRLNYDDEDFNKILIINMEECDGIEFKLTLIKKIFSTKDTTKIHRVIDTYIKEKMARKLEIIKNTVKYIKEYQDHAELYCRDKLGPLKKHYVELSRELYLYLGRKYGDIDMELMEWDRFLRTKKNMYPQLDIYITPILIKKLDKKLTVDLLTYAYIPLTLAYINEAAGLEKSPTEIIYEGPLGVENLK